jgi:hypothetical protein
LNSDSAYLGEGGVGLTDGKVVAVWATAMTHDIDIVCRS